MSICAMPENCQSKEGKGPLDLETLTLTIHIHDIVGSYRIAEKTTLQHLPDFYSAILCVGSSMT